MPRLEAARHECIECETTVEQWEGHPAPRLYGFTARQVAQALVAVAGGATYRRAAESIRLAAGRPLGLQSRPKGTGKGKLPAANRHAQIVSDWVDVFAPAIQAEYQLDVCPDIVVADDTAFMHKRAGAAQQVLAFNVLVATATVGRQPVVLAAQAHMKKDRAAWTALFASLPGAPATVVCDGAAPIISGARAAFRGSQIDHVRCQWHLWNNAVKAMPEKVLEALKADPAEPLRHLYDSVFTSSSGIWKLHQTVHDCAAVVGGSTARFDSWFRSNHKLVERQVVAYQTYSGPRSTGSAENVLATFRGRLGYRSAQFTNKHRLDRLLALMVCHANGQTDPIVWADIIRRTVTERAGHPDEQRQTVDKQPTRTLNW